MVLNFLYVKNINKKYSDKFYNLYINYTNTIVLFWKFGGL